MTYHNVRIHSRCKFPTPLLAQKFQENEVIMNHNHARLKCIWNLEKEDDFDDLEDLDFVCISRSHRWDHARLNWDDHDSRVIFHANLSLVIC